MAPLPEKKTKDRDWDLDESGDDAPIVDETPKPDAVVEPDPPAEPAPEPTDPVVEEPPEPDAPTPPPTADESVPTDLPPPAGATPATAPESKPAEAKAMPASAVPAAKSSPGGIDFGLRAEQCPHTMRVLSDRRKTKLEEEDRLDKRMAELYEYRPAQIVADLKGSIGLKCPYSFRRGQIILLPLWFALEHRNEIVVKG